MALDLRRRDFLRGLATVPCMGATATLTACPSGTDPLRFSGIPDGDKRSLKEGYDAVSAYLATALHTPVEYVHVPDYTAAVTALVSGAIDFAWLGGVTTVQAESRSPNGVHFVASRARDLKFRSYVIANKHVVEERKLVVPSSREPSTIEALEALKPKLQGATFSFGAKNSTSGHIMPRAFLTQADVSPEETFEGGPSYQLKGGHASTLRSVASRAVEFGVLNFATWEDADVALRNEAPVVYVTPEYVDYCLVATGSMPKARVDALRDALLNLDANDPTQATVLQAFSAKSFVRVEPGQWDGIRQSLRSLEANGALL